MIPTALAQSDEGSGDSLVFYPLRLIQLGTKNTKAVVLYPRILQNFAIFRPIKNSSLYFSFGMRSLTLANQWYFPVASKLKWTGVAPNWTPIHLWQSMKMKCGVALIKTQSRRWKLSNAGTALVSRGRYLPQRMKTIVPLFTTFSNCHDYSRFDICLLNHSG